MAEQLKEVVRARDSAEAGLKTTEKQFKDIRKQLHYIEIRQLVTELREELRKAREAAQLFKEAAKVEKQATYTLGVEETQARLTEEFSAVDRGYCDIFWGKTLNVAGVLADSGLRRPESIYYNPRFTSSQILIPLSLNKPPKCLSYQKWTKSLLLLWKFQ